ncbi:MAG TPA: HNH endonuclease [Jiangellaceae bacterium]|nr:HNH endonuclease [Jiangellaceae bacterium]
MKRDPRRLFTPADRAYVAARQHHLCGVCSNSLPDVFHVHHVIPWANGGPTTPDNAMAVCPDCHRDAPITTPLEFKPRAWQREALPKILPLLKAGEFATLSAAPGAGKTEFTAWAFNNLRDVGAATRMVVFGPNSHLRTQWRDVCKKRGIYLRSDSVTEHADEDGVVLTYAALSDSRRLEQLIADATEAPTLFVLDEVHHLAKSQEGEAGAWAVNIGRLVGTVDTPLHPVLNLSGTLFRSKRSERISTIHYRQDGNQIETVADYSILAGRLISERELRHIKVLGFDASMNVEAVDLAGTTSEGAETIQAVDLDGDQKLRSRVLPEMVRQSRFVRGILAETFDRLGHASAALQGAPVKALVIADDIDHADAIYAELSSQIGTRNSFIAHGRMNNPEKEINRFKELPGQGIMVAVNKITEGYDVPDVCVLTYLRTWRAPLFINQMVGRAMRVTDRERELGNYLPATVLVPNDSEVKKAFADVLVGAMNVLEAPPEPCERCGRDICACPPRPKNKICPRCRQSWKFCDCPCPECGLTKMTGCACWRKPSPLCDVCGKLLRYCICEGPPRVELITDPELAAVNVDGNDVELHIVDTVVNSIERFGIQRVNAEQAAAGFQEAMRKDPMSFMTWLRGEE